jgi:hypothetical protein
VYFKGGSVGIGTANPGPTLDVNGALQTRGQIRNDLGATGDSLVLTGTGSNLQVSHDGGANVALFNSGGGIQIRDTNGTTNMVTFVAGGNVCIGTTTPVGTALLTVNGYIASSGYYSTPITVASLPSAATAGSGSRYFVNNALAPVFGSTVAGGGAVNVPVYSDGANWKVG